MDKHLCLPWKGVDQSSSIRSWHLLWWSQPNVCLMNIRASLIHTCYEVPDKTVDLHPIITDITDLKGIIKVNMGCKKRRIRCQVYGVEG